MNSLLAPIEACPAGLSEQQVAQFRRDGFIAFEGVLAPHEVKEARLALRDMVENLRPAHRTLKSAYGEMWAALDSSLKVQFQSEAEADLDSVRKFQEFVGVNDFLTRLATKQQRIQSVLASLIGENPLLTQDMALVNPPGLGMGKPWHQDDAYFSVVPLDAVCGVWIALDEASTSNGCMNFLPGWHQKGALRHFHGADCEIVPDHLEGVTPQAVPLPPGGAVFFCGIAPHMTKPNTSTERRRALQFHYRAQDSRIAPREEYDAIFAEADGTPASCAAAAKRGF